MKIVALIGSPKKGNTYQLVKQVEECIKKYGRVEFTYLFLKDANLKICTGCFNCIRKGPEFCPIKDDKKMILDKMAGADGVILATPVYNFNVTSIMKNFIDRLAYIGHRPQFFSQHLMIISTTAGIGLKEVKKYLTEYAAKIWGFRTFTNLGLLTPPYQKSGKQIDSDNKKTVKMSKIFFYRMQSRKWSPKYHHIAQFVLIRAIFSKEKTKEAFPADYELYNSLWGKKFYFDVKVSRFKYGMASIMAQLVKLII